ncbi:MAG: tetratricopeptide repeat protein, partial [Dokdonella sp.]
HAASARALRRQLRGDLDNIALKAMAAEPENRYASAGSLADDVERHLDGQPVSAHPPSRWYRANKFIGRHRGGVAISAAFLLAVFAALTLALWQARVAQRELARAGEVQAFVEQLFEPLENGTANTDTPSLKELLDNGVKRIETSYPADLEVRANLLAMFARINDSIGETKSNLALAEAAWHANTAAFGADDERALGARSEYGHMLRKLGKLPEALSQYFPVRDAMRKQGLRGMDYARILDVISMVRMRQGISGDEAIALKQEVLREREADPNVTRESLATSYNNLGAAYQYATRLDDALIWYRKSYAIDVQDHPNSSRTANSLVNIGQIESHQGRWRDARETLQHALDLYRQTPVDRNISQVSLLIRLCAVETDLEEVSAAVPTCDQAVAMAMEVGGKKELNYAMALTRRAGLKVVEGNFGAAVSEYAAARQVIEESNADRRFNLNIVNNSEARMWLLKGDFPHLRDVMLELVDPVPDGEHKSPPGLPPAVMAQSAWAALACSHAPSPACGDHREATASAKAEDTRNWNHPLFLTTQIALAKIDLAKHKSQKAIERIHLALEHIEPLIGHGHSWVAEAHLVNELAQTQLGKSEAARLEHDQAAAIIVGLSPHHPLRTQFNDARPGNP